MGEKLELCSIASDLQNLAGILAGVEALCCTEELGEDALGVLGFTCRNINEKLCEISDLLVKSQRETGEGGSHA